jgi:RNA polymerase sigma-70 factor (ECF subfamily)
MTREQQESVLREWLKAHTGLMLKIVRAWAATPEDQEDLFQEILLQLWTSIPSFRGESRETTWIYRVAFNTALVWRRKETRRRHKHELLHLNEPLQPVESGTEGRDRREMIELVTSAIRQLPTVDASLALMHLDGLTYREMSEVLGISENHVGVKLNRIRKVLTEQMKGVVREF